MKILLIILSSIIIFQSCKVIDATKDIDSTICKLHNTEMKKVIVKTSYGFGCSDNNLPEFPNARKKKCMGCVVQKNRRFAVVYHCKTCTQLKKTY